MKVLVFILALILHLDLSAQKKTFDIVSYTAPLAWTEEVQESYVAYSKRSGDLWGQAAIYKSTASKGDIDSDMQKEWEAVVISLRAVEKEEKTAPKTFNGWTVMSKSGTWKYNGADVATILIVFSNGKTCVSLLCNATAESYLKEFVQMTQSVELTAQSITATGDPAPVSNNQTGAGSLIGLWGTDNNETSGYMNGMPETTGGYFRKEYEFYKDGTYLYRAKDWSNFAKEIRFAFETGTYKLTGDQLTLTPVQGKTEWWSKASDGRTSGWGRRIRTGAFKPEKVSYTMEIRYLSGMERSCLYLKSGKPTERDGASGAQVNALQEFSYGNRDKSEESLIDIPPGLKTGFERKR
ncbi:hypothetical protein LZZ85_05535 [Terrimonas sp. NA20]|uniref:Uncharacterized protein n=1 Tax=Terrimonas ginsenosidimutans TaxID=2908004 RepID=A0ABS9KN38_9BACT|nr:hypothetical protein [Terrimonas ginsenosidimutans]MCG2613729.1 hypothetical protein [Terrimonas ginsenosidimutans]